MELISIKEAAGKLGLSVRRVHQLIAAGRLPAQKVGSYYVIRPGDLAKLDNRKVGRPSLRAAADDNQSI